MKNSNLRRGMTHVACSAFAVALMGGFMTSCQDDLLTGQPEWLGESIYAELESRGNFTQTLKLINAQDEDYASVLKKTGSKTLFVADDASWEKFFQNNPWGVKSIDEMTEAQKKLLFKSNMINSAYLVELLGNIPSSSDDEKPIEGACMRRATSVNIMDSVPVVPKSQYPVINPVRLNKDGEQIDYWSRVRENDSILLLQDESVASMIHFMPKFMVASNITSNDVEFLTNGEIKSNTGAFVNGKVITEKDIVCQNGYIHVTDGVAVPLDNMANVISNDGDFTIYNRLLDRFSYPSYSESMSKEYQRQYGGKETDSVFVKRYFNSHKSHNFTARDVSDGGLTVSTQLPFDPGWNRYEIYSTSGNSFQQNAAVMMVPTDQAMLEFLENDGKDIKERYGNAGPGATAWDNAPDEVVLPLLKNTMLPNMKSSIPSMFNTISNTAGEHMGVKEADIDKTLWACNGVVYKTNKVYVAPEYVSVFYPCVIRATEDLHLNYTVVDNDNRTTGGEGFYAYLNNMGAKYSYVIPTDNALQYYFDPVSRYRTNNKGVSTATAYKFEVNDAGYIAAVAYLVDWDNLDEKGRGTITQTKHTHTPTNSAKSDGETFNHFKDILNSSLAVELFTPGQKFYTAKNYAPIIVNWEGNKVTGVAGSFQYERNYFVPVVEEYDKSLQGNGRSYIVDEEPLMSTTISPYSAINNADRANNFGVFANLMNGLSIVMKEKVRGHATQDYALTNLDNYYYTIYIPQNENVQELIDAHKLPTWDDIDDIVNCYTGVELDEETEAFLMEQEQEMRNVISNFVTYHMQDQSVYIDGKELSSGLQNNVFETACMDTLTNRFVKINVDYQLGGQMKVTDNCGNVRTVLTDATDDAGNPLYNILTRQLFFDGASLAGDACQQIYNSSFAVIHQIDAPLFPNNHSLYDPETYKKVMDIVAAHPIGGETPNPVKRHKR